MSKNDTSDSEIQNAYEVEELLDIKKTGKTILFLVKWKNYGVEENTWEPSQNLIDGCPDLLEEIQNQFQQYELKYKNYKKKKPKFVEYLQLVRSKNNENHKNENDIDENKGNDQNNNQLVENLNSQQNICDETALKRKGQFDLGDQPLKIQKATIDINSKLINVEIAWKFNEQDNIQPQNTVINSQVVRKHAHDMLLDYYESKITYKLN